MLVALGVLIIGFLGLSIVLGIDLYKESKEGDKDNE